MNGVADGAAGGGVGGCAAMSRLKDDEKKIQTVRKEIIVMKESGDVC